uniref:Uncharacterized protein n=1 Tax=Timema douglasi TaxID=61478 RepID=A0A7R8ZIH6_TIMDO|nr:unnamed protein product [Timema douglasi]
MKWYASAVTRFCGCLRTIVNIIQLSWCGQTARGTTRNNKSDDAAVRALQQEALARVTPESWSKNVNHTGMIGQEK